MSNEKRFESIGNLYFAIDHAGEKPTHEEVRQALINRIDQLDSLGGLFEYAARIDETIDYENP